MKMTIVSALALLCAGCLSERAEKAFPANPVTRAGDRTDVVLTYGWTADGVPVTLPHTWNVPDGEDGPTEDGVPEGTYRPGRGWTAKPSTARFAKEEKDENQSVRSLGYARKCVTYRRDLPDPDPERRYFVRCEAACTYATVVVNGRVVGRHANAFTGFTFEITGAMRRTKNVLEIAVDNFYDQQGLPVMADYTMFGGLYRPVHLITTPAACFDLAGEGYGPGVSVQADATTGRVKVDVRTLRPDGTNAAVKITYAVPEARVTSESPEFAVPGFKLWSPESPTLYHLVATLSSEWGTDTVTVPFGFRTAEFRADGFYLNGRKRKLRGVNWHQDVKGKGWAISHEDERLSARLIKDMGADAVRTAHYPHSQGVYDLCDEMGLVAWCELPVTDRTSTGTVSRARARAAIKEMTAQYGHHPSIAMWSLSNEVRTRGSDGGTAGTVAMHRELDAAFREDDPTRPTVLASCFPDQTNVNRVATAFGFNTYPGWYGGKPEEIGPYIAWALKVNGLSTLAVSEYGGGANPDQHENPAPERCRKPLGPWHPEEYQTRHHEVHYREIKRNPNVWGSFVWQMFDSAADSTLSGPIPGINDKGLVTRDRRTLKDAYAFYRANWHVASQLYLAGTRMTSTTNPTYDVLAFCNAGPVTLKVNGRWIGTVEPDEVMCAKWKAVPLEPGRNVLEVSAKGLPSVRQELIRLETDR